MNSTGAEGIELIIDQDGVTYHCRYSKADAKDNVIVLGRMPSGGVQSGSLPPSPVGGQITSKGRASFVSPVMSRQHARLVFSGDGFIYLSDPPNHSHHGTFITRGGHTFRVEHPEALQGGDKVTFGRAVHRGGEVYYPITANIQFTSWDPPRFNPLNASFNGHGYSLPPAIDDDIEYEEDFEVYKDDDEEEHPSTHKFYSIEELPEDDSSDSLPTSSPVIDFPINSFGNGTESVTPDIASPDPLPLPSLNPFAALPSLQSVWRPFDFNNFPKPPEPMIPPIIPFAPPPRAIINHCNALARTYIPLTANRQTAYEIERSLTPFPHSPPRVVIDVDAPVVREVIDVDALSTPETDEDSHDSEASESAEEDAVGSDEDEDEVVSVATPPRTRKSFSPRPPSITRDLSEENDLKEILRNVQDLTEKLDKLLVYRNRSKRRITLNKLNTDVKIAALNQALATLSAKVDRQVQQAADEHDGAVNEVQAKKTEILDDMEARTRSFMADVDIYEDDVTYEVDRVIESVDGLASAVDQKKIALQSIAEAIEALKTRTEAQINAELDSIRASAAVALGEMDSAVAGVKRKRDELSEEDNTTPLAPAPREATPVDEALEPHTTPELTTLDVPTVEAATEVAEVTDPPAKRQRLGHTIARHALSLFAGGAALYIGLGMIPMDTE